MAGGQEIAPGKTLLIFDEVQEFPRARAAIKYLVADGRYHYLETGSLISIQENVADIVIPSEEDHVKMYEDKGMDRKEAMKAAAADRGVTKRDIYSYLEKNRSKC